MSLEGENLVLEVVDWDRNFENSRSRAIENARWVPVPNRHDGLRYSRLIKNKDGAELFAAWILIVEVASKCQRRGVLTHSDGSAMTREDLAEVTRAPLRWFEKAVPYLLGCRWLRYLDANEVTDGCQSGDKRASGKRHSGDSDGDKRVSAEHHADDGYPNPPRVRGMERRNGRKEGNPPSVPQGGPESGLAGAESAASTSQPDDFLEKKERGAAGVVPGEPVDVRGRWFLERVCAIWERDARRTLGYDAQMALPGVLEIERATLEQELKVVEWFHRLPADDSINELKARRTSVEKLIMHWPEEVDRARGYAKKVGAVAILGPKKERRAPVEPEGWQRAARSLSDSPDHCVIPERFADLPADVQRDVIRILAAEKEEGA